MADIRNRLNNEENRSRYSKYIQKNSEHIKSQVKSIVVAFSMIGVIVAVMLFCVWDMASWHALGGNNTAAAYFSGHTGGFAIGMAVIFFAGWLFYRVSSQYYSNMIDYSIKQEEAYEVLDKSNKELTSIMSIFMTAYDVNILEDSFTGINTGYEKVSRIIGNSDTERVQGNANAILKTVMTNTTSERLRNQVLEFADLSTLGMRMAEEEILTLEFENAEGLWRRGRFIVSERDDKGRVVHVLWLVEDIEEEKRMRSEMEDKAAKAEAASRAKSAFLSNMSHEIRTPINAVLGMNEMILRECDDETVLMYSENIKVAGNTLLGIVNDILDFSKIEAGRLEILPVDYDVSSIINDLVNMIRTRIDEKGLTFSIDIDGNIPRLMHGDEVRIKQVITNILTNAAKYTQKGGITFSVGYEKVSEKEADVMVSVKDTGIGIRPEDIDRLFTKFDRIEEERNRNIEGTGLGLSITNSLLQMMGSKLMVESTYGEGSRFYFTLRQRVVKWEALGDYETTYRKQNSQRKAYEVKFTAPEADVLVVDDNPMNLVVFSGLLKQTLVNIDQADSGDVAIAMSMEHKYDMIFLDHMMPNKDGIETLHDMRSEQNNPNIYTPVICLTANAISGAREEYISEGFDDYLAKPINSDRLEKMMMRYLPPEKIITVKASEASGAKGAKENSDDDCPLPEALMSIDGIDTNIGLKNSGSAAAYIPLVKMFYESIDGNAAEIEGYFVKGDYKNYTIKVHALKSSARIIGAAALGEAAQLLEDAGKKGDYEYIKQCHDAFLGNYQALKAPLADYFGSKDDGRRDKPYADAELMGRVYDDFRMGAEDMDCDRLECILHEMEDYRITEDEREKYDMIADAASKYEYDKILEILDMGT